jgi:hypothetical protein
MNRMAKVGIWLDAGVAEKRWRYGQNVFGLYLEEILGHAGVPFKRLDSEEALDAYAPDFLLVAQSGESDASLQLLTRFVEEGGTLISYAGLNRMAASLGCRETAYRDIAYAELPADGTAADGIALRALSVKPWFPLDTCTGFFAAGTLRQRRPQGDVLSAACLTFPAGAGKWIRWNVDIPATIVAFQQGTSPVVEDGIPAPDGSGTLDEGLLKADDRCEMDWELDRRETESGMSYFATPYADLWRETLVAQILRESLALGLVLPFLDYWPDGVEQVATVSHDSDFNLEESAAATLDVLKECGIRSTWCMIEPGYSRPTYDRIKQDGHELAFHYNALEKENGFWDCREFERQLDVIRTETSAPIRTNKNHYTRFEGWGDLFSWCEANGITADQTRGPSKKGNIGFLFGTCHPYYPVAWADERNRRYNVLEVGFLTQDLDHPSLADPSVIDPFLSETKRVRGIAHFLYHQQHILQLPQVTEALKLTVSKAKAAGFVFWTTEEIVNWEHSRRQTVLSIESEGQLQCEHAPAGSVILIPLDTKRDVLAPDEEVRFGVVCRKVFAGKTLSTITQE